MENPLPERTYQLLQIFNEVTPGEIASTVVAIIIILILLFCSALVAGSENAFFSIPKQKLDHMKEEDSPVAKALLFLLGKPKTLLATILITNNFINIAFVLVSNTLFDLLINPEIQKTTTFFVCQVTFITFIIVFLAEITPKIYATQHYMSFSRLMALPIYYLSKFWSPFVWILVKSTSIIDKRITKKGHMVTVDDLEHAIEITSHANQPRQEKEILKGIVNFGNIDVKQISRPRMDVKSVDVNWDFTQVMAYFNEWGYSRMPACDGSFDKVKGILTMKDLLPHIDKPSNYQWQELIREAFFVPESKMIDDLLKEFQAQRKHIAIVFDEFGGNLGIVTMEDILEEIFGEIHDEFDEDERLYSQLDANTFIFEGKTLINDVCKLMKVDPDSFEKAKGEAETLAGLLLELNSKLPFRGQKIDFTIFNFTIEAVDKRRISRIKVVVKR